MNKQLKRFATVGLAAVMALTIAGTALAAGRGGNNTGRQSTGSVATAPLPSAVAATPLSDVEKQALVFMIEEEKLAHDVYAVLHDTWGANVFQNILKSEAKHMASIRVLIDRYGLTDPTIGNDRGEFTNTDLQALYDTLVAQGSESLSQALQVGVAIEKLDIKDLETHIAETTHADIKTVYQNLLRGSQNHLKAFTRVAAR